MTPNPDLTTGLDTALRTAAEQLRRVVAELDREVEASDPQGLALPTFEPWRLRHMQSVIAAALFLEEVSECPPVRWPSGGPA